MERMRAELQANIERERAVAAELKANAERERVSGEENSRLRVALDRIGAGAMVTDLNGKIIYANGFAKSIFRTQASEFRQVLPQFDAEQIVGQSLDIFDRVPSLQRNVLAGLSSSYTTDAVVGGARLRVTSNPVIGGDGKPLGTVLQWLDRTQEVTAEEEVKETVARAIEGDLTARLREEGKDGFFAALAKGMNSLISNMADVIRGMAQASAEVRTGADEISRGNLDLSQRTEEQASSLEQTAASMEQMTSIVKNNADNAAQANKLAVAARDHAETGGQVVGSAVFAMARSMRPARRSRTSSESSTRLPSRRISWPQCGRRSRPCGRARQRLRSRCRGSPQPRLAQRRGGQRNQGAHSGLGRQGH